MTATRERTVVRVEIAASKGSADAARSRAVTLSERLTLDPERVLRWAVIKAIVLDQAARSA